MASGLRAKINAMRSSQPAAPPPRAPAGLMQRVSHVPLEPGIHALSQVGLRRMGWTGERFDVDRCLFIDTETTGLSGGAGTVAFLVGAGYCDSDRFTIEQFMMREYADEPELIDRLKEVFDVRPVILTSTMNQNHTKIKIGFAPQGGREKDV